MVSQKVVIKNPTGLHLRPAGILCKEAMQFKSLITFQFRGSTANAKSVLSVLGACVKSGDEIEFFCEGEDEQEALDSLVRAVENGLGEYKGAAYAAPFYLNVKLSSSSMMHIMVFPVFKMTSFP